MRSSRLLVVACLVAVVAMGSLGPALAWTVGSRYVTVPCTTGCGQQDYNNWCGVASTHAVLHKLGKNISQATLASKYGVGKADGSAVAIERIPGVLNGYVSGFDYVHVKRTDVNSASLMASIAQFCTDNGYLGIPCVNPYPYTNSAGQTSPGLPTYSGTQKRRALRRAARLQQHVELADGLLLGPALRRESLRLPLDVGEHLLEVPVLQELGQPRRGVLSDGRGCHRERDVSGLRFWQASLGRKPRSR